MRVGWSAEIRPNHWVKINCDEEDLARLFVEFGIDVTATRRVPVDVVYRLLDLECERLLLAKLITAYGYGEESRKRLAELAAARAEILDALRARLPATAELQPA